MGMWCADRDPPCSQRLLCRAVGSTFRFGATHRGGLNTRRTEAHSVIFERKADMVDPSRLDRFGSVHRPAMPLAQRLSTAALLIAVAGIGVSPAAQAHNNHHHHTHKKQKAYNKGYRKGYNKAVKQTYRPYYRTHYRPYAPVYAPVRRRVVVAPAPWIAPIHPYNSGTRVNVGLGFNL